MAFKGLYTKGVQAFSLFKAVFDGVEPKTATAIITAGGILWFHTTELVEAKHKVGIEAVEANQAKIEEIENKTEAQMRLLSNMQVTMQKLEKTLDKVDERVYQVYRESQKRTQRR